MKKRLTVLLKTISLILPLILILGTLYEQGSQLFLNKNKPDKSEFCHINGLNIHFKKAGSGGPTVVFQSGLGGDYKVWEKIQDSVSHHTTTISYDRAGLLWSDPFEGTKTMQNITSELQQLLEKTNCPKPYILVGHSLAGITLRPFIQQNTKDISGIVFVDVSHPLQIKNASEDLKKYLVTPPKWLLGTLVETGILRVYLSVKPFIAELPPSHWMNRHIANYFYTFYKTLLREAADDDVMFEEAETITSFGNVPLRIVTGAYPMGADFLGKKSMADEYLSLHRKQQKDLLNLSSDSRQIIAQNSGHYVPLQDPQVLIGTITDLQANPHTKEKIVD